MTNPTHYIDRNNNFAKQQVAHIGALITDKVEYMVIVIGEFARTHRLTTQQAYLYLKRHRGIEFLNKSYDVEHLFSIEDAVDDVSEYCQRQAEMPS
ncbi:MAG: DUF3791 domain-containing protein [Prevotellaceae bacterium]|jgi:hypothetical protein|nr:DUF3791 domain-containing protein [Prevotellaceae bacterium]